MRGEPGPRKTMELPGLAQALLEQASQPAQTLIPAIFDRLPYCPEFSPIEQVWQHLKQRLRWQLPPNLDGLRQLVKQGIDAIDRALIAFIVGRQSILEALSVAGI